MKPKKKPLGFKQAMVYVLDVLCYAYYVKEDNLVSDFTFDELERIYCVITGEDTCPNRGNEGDRFAYTIGVQVVYDELKKRRKETKKPLIVDQTTENQ